MKKHDHKKTKDIKSKLFYITMLLPFLYIAAVVLIIAFNENALAQNSSVAEKLAATITSLKQWPPISWANSASNPIRQTIQLSIL